MFSTLSTGLRCGMRVVHYQPVPSSVSRRMLFTSSIRLNANMKVGAAPQNHTTELLVDRTDNDVCDVAPSLWTTKQVCKWASGVPGMEAEDILLLRKNRITGDTLVEMTEQRLLSYGLPGGPAIKLINAIARVKELTSRNLHLSPLTATGPTVATQQLEGIDTIRWTTWMTERKETVQAIARQLEQSNVVLIQGPPFSGKTALLQLLERHYKFQFTSVAYVNLLNFTGSQPFHQFWKDVTGRDLEHWFLSDQPRITLLDELQVLYNYPDNPLWKLLKSVDSRRPNIKVVCTAVYGSSVRPNDATPYTFRCTRGLDLLLCSQYEFFELIQDFNDRHPRKHKKQVTESLATVLYRMTQGHLGFLSRILYLYSSREDVTNTASFGSFILSNRFLADLRSLRGVPEFRSFTEKQQDFCRRLLNEEILPFPYNYHEFDDLIKNGTIVFQRDGTYAKFSSPIVAYVATFHFFRSKSIRDVATLEELIFETLRGMRSSFLQRSLGKGNDEKLLERTWQMEFFRVATSLVNDAVHVSPDVGHMFGTTGLVDFYVNDSRKWAIEVMRDGGSVEKHLQRFTPGGLYDLIPISQKAILYFTQKQVSTFFPDVWYIQYNSNFTCATILRLGQEPVEILFVV